MPLISDSQFENGVNEHRKVVADYFTKKLVVLTDFRLGPQIRKELALDSRERALDVRSFVVVLLEQVPVVVP